MSKEVLIAIISAIPSILVAVVTVINSNRVISYKIDALEKKQEKFNNLIERTFVAERDIKTAFNQIQEVKEDVTRLEEKLLHP